MFDDDQLGWDLIEEELFSRRTDLEIETIRRNPGYAITLDKIQANRYPIHLASEKGRVEIVKELIRSQGDSTQCFLRDKEGRTPLDYAAMKGSIGVIRELLSACSNDQFVSSDQERVLVEGALYFALKNNQREAFRFLAMWFMKDWDTKTVENIKKNNKLLMDDPWLSLFVAAPSTKDLNIEAFNELLMDAMSSITNYYDLNKFLAKHPFICAHLDSGFYPLETHLRIAVFARQTDDLLEKIINNSPYQFLIGLNDVIDPSTTILHMVSRYGYVEIVKILLNQFGGSLCLLKDSEGRTALHCAVTDDYFKKVKVINELLSACWESVREVTVKGETALHLALKQEENWFSISFSKILLMKHIENEILKNNDNWDVNKITSASDLADNYIKIVNELFSQDDDCQLCLVKNMDDNSFPYYYAVIKGKNKDDILYRLFSVNYPEYIPDVTAQNQTVLHLSMDRRSLITLKVLLGSRMVNEILDIKDEDGNTVFSLITKQKRPSNLVGVASVNYQTYEDVIRLLHVVRMGDLETFNDLIDEDPSVLDKVASFPTLGGTPLNIAMNVYPLRTNIVIDIINRRPSFATQLNYFGVGPIHLASRYLGNVEIVRELLTKVGSSQCLLLDGDGRTALHIAARYGNVDVINELLSAHFESFSVVDKFGHTPLEKAVIYDEYEAKKILMERHIEDELLNNNYDWNGNLTIVSNLAKEYVQIMKELLMKKVGSSLCILQKKIIEGNEEHLEYYAVIKGTSYNNFPHLFLHPKVTAKSQMVLHLSVDEKSKITLKVLLRSPFFYNNKKWGQDLFERICWYRRNTEVEVDENEMETTVIIWKSASKESQPDAESDGAEEQQSDDVRVPKEVVGNKDGNKELSAKVANEERVLGVNNPIMKQARSPLQNGDMFRSLEECRIAIIDAMVLAKRVVKFLNSRKEKIVVNCSNKSCEWRINARPKKNNDGFVVKIHSGNHTCPILTSAENKLATPTWVSYHVKDEVKKDPEFELKQIQRFIRLKFGIDITNTTAWRAKIKALERIHGSWTESYRKLPEYLNRVLQSNPESIAFLETNTDNKFHRLFISYKACLNVFLKGCAPFVFIDGIRTEQGLGGVMILAAMGVDGNNDMIPIAVAVADTNSISTWEWFLSQLQFRILQHPGYNKMTIISNHLYGLAEVINIHFPNAKHGHCTWNLSKIMEKEFGHKILSFYWQIAKALTNEEYNLALMGLKLKNVKAADWIEENHPEYWAASKFEGDIYRHITSNVAEKFSKWIGPLRHLPILAMLKQIHEDLMEFFGERREATSNSSSCLTEYAEKFIEKAANASTSFSVIEVDTSIYQVHDNNNNLVFLIDISWKSCTCLVWQKLGIPCSHAIAAFKNAQISPPYLSYCSPYYRTQVYRLAYTDIFKPVLPISPEGSVKRNDILPPTKEKIPADCLVLKRKRSSMNQFEASGSRGWRLHFRNKLPDILFTDSRIVAGSNRPVEVVILDANSEIVKTGPQSSIKIGILVLDGDFGTDGQEVWSAKEFGDSVVREREGKRPLVTGGVHITLKDGVGYLADITITDNSSWVRSGKFKLGARVVRNTYNNDRIIEARSGAFVVRDHRGQGYQKHHPPSLNDEIWRLAKIRKDDVFHKRLASKGIKTVQDFLRFFVTDPSSLRSAFASGMSSRKWEAIIRHAKTCVLDTRTYIYSAQPQLGLIFNSIYEVIGATFDGQNYLGLGNLNPSQMNLVDSWKQHAYQHLNGILEITLPPANVPLIGLPYEAASVPDSTLNVQIPNFQTTHQANQELQDKHEVVQPQPTTLDVHDLSNNDRGTDETKDMSIDDDDNRANIDVEEATISEVLYDDVCSMMIAYENKVEKSNQMWSNIFQRILSSLSASQQRRTSPVYKFIIWCHSWICEVHQHAVPIGIGRGDLVFFRDLFCLGRWLTDTHMDAWLYHLRVWKKRFPATFGGRWTTTDCLFITGLLERKEKFKDAGKYDWVQDGTHLSYVKGKHILEGVSWNTVDEVYCPVNINRNQWVALVIDLIQREIRIYDSMSLQLPLTHHTLGCLTSMIPDMLINSGCFDRCRVEHFRSKLWSLECVANVPQQVITSGDCGIYALKFIEFLSSRQKIKEWTIEEIKVFRSKMAIELYSYHI